MKYLAIDIGGTNLKYGYVSQDGHLLQHWTIPVPTNYNDLLQKITAIYLSSENILGVGISSPGIYWIFSFEIFNRETTKSGHILGIKYYSCYRK